VYPIGFTNGPEEFAVPCSRLQVVVVSALNPEVKTDRQIDIQDPKQEPGHQLRLFSALQRLVSMSMNSGPSRKLVEIFKPTVYADGLFLATLVYSMFVLVNLLGCIWYFTAYKVKGTKGV
jgi:hypothetical protein